MHDLINGLFEVFGFVAISLSVVRVYKDKAVKGISPLTTVFFTSWGFWNLVYYPHLHQGISTLGAGLTCLANVAWLSLLLYYRHNSSTK